MLCCRPCARVRLAQSCHPREGGDLYAVSPRKTAEYGSRASLTLARDDRTNSPATTVEKGTPLIPVPACAGTSGELPILRHAVRCDGRGEPATTTKSGIAAISS